MIVVERHAEDFKSVRMWEFRASGGYDGVYLTLTRYMEGTRPTRRHKLKGEMWDSSDERSYHSKLPRPTSIPDDVIAEAMTQLQVKVSIGWTREDCVVAKRKAA